MIHFYLDGNTDLKIPIDLNMAQQYANQPLDATHIDKEQLRKLDRIKEVVKFHLWMLENK